MARNDPIRNFRFQVTVGTTQAGFSEVAIAETTTDAIDYREGNQPPHVTKLPGLTKYGNITLKYGATADSLSLYQWYKTVLDGVTDRRAVTIEVMDELGQNPVARFQVTEAWPVKYDPSDLNAKGNEVVIELLELVHEGLLRVN